jgi:hypothetical protein
MRMRLQSISRQAYREKDKPQQGDVASTLRWQCNGAVGFIDWLGRGVARARPETGKPSPYLSSVKIV